jgi:diguanylate cyclase (GGDEF)-like protein
MKNGIKRRKLFSNIKARLYLTALLPIILFFIISAGWFHIYFNRIVREHQQNVLSLILDIEEQTLSNWFTQQTFSTQKLAQGVALRDGSFDRIEAYFNDIIAIDKKLCYLFFITPDNTVRVDICSTGNPELDIDFAELECLEEAREGQAILSDQILRTREGSRLVFAAAPVYGEDSKVRGFLLTAHDLENSISNFSEMSSSFSGQIFITDREGELIAGPVSPSASEGEDGRQREATIEQNLGENILGYARDNKQIPTPYRNYAGVRVQGDYRWIKDGSWLLVGEIQTSISNQRYSGFLFFLALMLFLSIILLLPLVVKLSSAIATPIRTLDAEAKRMREKEPSLYLDWNQFSKAPVEVRNLAYSFYTMAEQLQEYVESLEHTTVTDHLTGLYNRKKLFEEGYRYLHMVYRSKISLACLMMDIDHFKWINDTYGHSFGDTILRQVATQIKNSIRETDLAARYGGEEFTVLAYRTNINQALRLAERLRATVAEKTYEFEQDTLTVTISIGVALIDNSSMKQRTKTGVKEVFDRLLHESDEALYEAKERGRDQVVMYGGPNKEAE